MAGRWQNIKVSCVCAACDCAPDQEDILERESYAFRSFFRNMTTCERFHKIIGNRRKGVRLFRRVRQLFALGPHLTRQAVMPHKVGRQRGLPPCGWWGARRRLHVDLHCSR